MHMAGSTVFTWYGKRQRLQYYLCSNTPRRLHNAHLAWPGGTVLKVRRAWQCTVLGIAVDLSALPYLLCLIPGTSPSGRPRSVVPSWSRPCRSRKNHEQRSGVSLIEKGGRSWTVSPPWPGLPVGDRIVALACHYVSGLTRDVRVVAMPSAGLSFFCREAGPLGAPGL